VVAVGRHLPIPGRNPNQVATAEASRYAAICTMDLGRQLMMREWTL